MSDDNEVDVTPAGAEEVEDEQAEQDNSINSQGDSEESGDKDNEAAEEDPGTSKNESQSKSARNKKKKKKSKKKSKSQDLPDPYTRTSAELCGILGMVDVHLEYTDKDFDNITSGESFSARFKPELKDNNPDANEDKLNAVLMSKYNEYQQLLAEEGRTLPKKIPSKPVPLKSPQVSSKPPPPPSEDENVPYKFRPSTRKTRDSDLGGAEWEKEERRQAKVEKAALKKAKKAKPKESEEIDIQQKHQENCEECQQQSGEIIHCDTCQRAYHLVCFDPDLKEVPEGLRTCSKCNDYRKTCKNLQGSKEQQTKTGDVKTCIICDSGDFLLLCTHCSSSYHAFCLSPPLKELIEEEHSQNWVCPQCSIPDTGGIKVEKILSSRWIEIKYPDPVSPGDAPKNGETLATLEDNERKKRLYLHPPTQMEPRREREFFIKWKFMSYWRCCWVNELIMKKHYNLLLKQYLRVMEAETPSEIDDGSFEDMKTGMVEHKDKEADSHYMEQKFYRYGIKPEWMQVQRIIDHTDYGNKEFGYLVKWREMDYGKATWEPDEALFILGFEEAVYKYWLHRERMTGESIPQCILKKINQKRAEKRQPTFEEDEKKRKKREGPSTDPKNKWETQPDYVSETGCTLHPYQLEGINWLRHCWATGTNSLLADEMGLGKTIQSMVFVYSLIKEGHTKSPFLISVPLTTLINWEREAEIWAPDLYVVAYNGTKDDRIVIREHEFSFTKSAEIKGKKASRLRTDQGLKFHVLLTSYEYINKAASIFSSIEWAAIIVDEAHRLKNNQSLFSRSLRSYRTSYKLLLTGTPLQNNMQELFHLLSFINPDRFYDLKSFIKEFADISKEDQIQKLHSLLGPHMLRRLKADVLTGIPSKTELIVRVELSPMQKKYYRSILRYYEDPSVKKDKSSILNIIMELKKCANHPYLFSLARMEAPKLANGNYEGEALIKNSGKFLLLQKMLPQLKKDGHRVLIFSQMTKMLDILEDLCEHLQYKYERFDGSDDRQRRQDAIDRFNAPNAQQFVFLLSTRAGGLGVNLTTADTVIIYDSDWNPHNDIQAFSRAHRIGQQRKVMIYRFVTRNTVEERIATVAKRKMLLTHLVVRAGIGQKGPSMTKSELDDVLRWGTEELFKEEEEGKSSEHNIVWDDKAVDALLERGTNEVVPEETGTERKNWANEYLSSFKVATYNTQEEQEEEEETESTSNGEVSAEENTEENGAMTIWDERKRLQEILGVDPMEGKKAGSLIDAALKLKRRVEELEKFKNNVLMLARNTESFAEDPLNNVHQQAASSPPVSQLAALVLASIQNTMREAVVRSNESGSDGSGEASPPVSQSAALGLASIQNTMREAVVRSNESGSDGTGES